MAETIPQLHPALLRLSAMTSPVLHCDLPLAGPTY
jgi:hypothetical protein